MAGNILIYGAGVIGTVYAMRFAQAGFNVTVVARGDRLEALRGGGLRIRHAFLKEEERAEVRCLERLDPLADYDLVLITVRAAQVVAAAEEVGRLEKASAVVVVGNNFQGHIKQENLIGRSRFVLGFGAFGGYRQDGVIVYLDGRTQKRPEANRRSPTTMGIISQLAQNAIEVARSCFEQAGLPVTVSTDMPAWLKCHAALVFPLAGAIYACGGEQARTCKTRDALVLGIRACREMFYALRRLGVKTEPRRLNSLLRTPEPLIVRTLRKLLASESAAVAMFGHANAVGGRDEIADIAKELDLYCDTAGTSLPHWKRLLPYFERNTSIQLLEEGQRTLRLRLW